jgi:hypothetical protein
MADKAEPKRLLGTSKSLRGGQYYAAPSSKSTLERGRDAGDAYWETNKGKPGRGKNSAVAFAKANQAAISAEFRDKAARQKENASAKSRVGKPRGGK